ncbi:tRNA1(Val) (adenine(37)-N6)-methyltransferase [Alkalihalobacillus sp. MEB130]|uniref:tRNA1(Val) (adenine(37)-N6)-methyltransferase n=1 Tax=Alkalihalobacillus sp. MEB130 TaxID=2976704 RepID=UPI0028DD4B91|nr:tRNA1(Val) (adenine(37)-N6)-methyltransferase [Alkalihalobacillus sp. MEB130]MDT8862627.1 tRNA1(Val) (adenine(37)-N6)-methyltransferase [Alkalihalobacillus sp. MEB130]
MKLQEGERIDYIAGTDLRVVQSPHVFSFSIDAILLGRFVHVPIQKGNILDLCTGNGVIPVLLTTRSKARIVGIDIQSKLVEMANRTLQLNDIHNQIEFMEADLNQIPSEVTLSSFDVVTCNPPYFETVTEHEKNRNKHLAIARHEIYCTLEDVIRVCSQYVKQKGKVALVHRPERLTDIMTLMRTYRIEPKRIQFVHPKEQKEANMVLVEGIKDGKSGVTCLPPIVVYNEQGTYSESFRSIYEGIDVK